MAKFVAKRFVYMIITLFLVFTATFFLLASIPGNALTMKIHKLPAQAQERIMQKYGYDKPAGERYLLTLKNVVTKGDFGESIAKSGDTLGSILQKRLPPTVRLNIQQMIVGVTLGLILGIIAAMKRAKAPDFIILIFCMFMTSVPSLVIALILQLTMTGPDSLFNLPIIGWPKGKDLWFGGWKFTILPTFAGALFYVAGYARTTKIAMLDSIYQECTTTARAIGMSETQVMLHHVVRNSFIPIVTFLPGTIAGMLSGSLFIERVFSVPGIGSYYVECITQRDVPMVLGFTVFYSAITIVSIFVSDVLYGIVDPRIKLVSGSSR